eukprot:237036-Chlamydomonas_euryale.AAC.1
MWRRCGGRVKRGRDGSVGGGEQARAERTWEEREGGGSEMADWLACFERKRCRVRLIVSPEEPEMPAGSFSFHLRLYIA